jgi:hypothetical protein
VYLTASLLIFVHGLRSLDESRKHTRVHVKAPKLEDQQTPEELTETYGDDSDNVIS